MNVKVIKIVTYFILIILVLIWMLPIYATFLAAFKSPEDFTNQKFYQFPTKFSLIDNIKDVFRIYRLQEHFFNSIIYAVVGAGIAIIAASMAGFSIVRLKPKFNFLWFLIIFSGTLFPFQMYLIPLYKIYITTGLYDTKLGMILVYAALCTPFSLLVYRGFYTTIPREIEEAAKIDGCNPFKLYIYIFLPQSIAPTAVVALFQMTWIWNDLLFGMILTRSNNTRPVMISLAQMFSFGNNVTQYTMVGVMFTSLPTIFLFLWLRRYFIQGMALQVLGE